jgi:hypothetical protein
MPDADVNTAPGTSMVVKSNAVSERLVARSRSGS